MSNVPNAVQRTVTAHIDNFRRLLLTVDATARQGLNSFWRDVRQSLNDQDGIITTLRQQVTQLQQNNQHPIVIQAPARPDTTDSVDAIRRTVEIALQNDALQAHDASNTLEEICDLDMIWVRNFLLTHKNGPRSAASKLDCWMNFNSSMLSIIYSLGCLLTLV